MSLTQEQQENIAKLMLAVLVDGGLSVKSTGELINKILPGALTEEMIESFEKKQFNPDQPRDANGQFASVGGGGISGGMSSHDGGKTFVKTAKGSGGAGGPGQSDSVKNNIKEGLSKKTKQNRLAELSKHDDAGVRTSVADNNNAHPDVLNSLSKDKEVMVRSTVASNPSTHQDTLDHLALNDNNEGVRAAALRNNNTRQETLVKVARDKSQPQNIRVTAKNAAERRMNETSRTAGGVSISHTPNNTPYKYLNID